MARLVCGNVLARQPIVLLARLVSTAGALLEASDVAALTYRVFVLSSDAAEPTVTAAGEIDPASAISDVLQLDGRWTRDKVGYNFAWTAAAAAMPEGDRTYRFEIQVVPFVGEPWVAAFEARATPIYTPLPASDD